MQHVVDLSSDDFHVDIYHGFLTVSKDRKEVGRVALDDIGSVITHSHELTWSNTVFTTLSERAVPIVLCAENHASISCVWPREGNHIQGARSNAQINSSSPVSKRLWRDIVVAKIRMQGAVLASMGIEAGAFEALAKKVKSGDPENIEAQAARRYWKLLLGWEFRRDTNGDGINALLNYGYAVLRAIISRAICAAGLHPTIGLHHSNPGNAFALADDLMEPYRPLVDRAVVNLVEVGFKSVEPEPKRILAALSAVDLKTSRGNSPLYIHSTRLAQQLASIMTDEYTTLELPIPPDAEVLNQLGKLPAPGV